MGRYFDYSDWNIEELCDHIRERIDESKKPIPPKIMKHSVSILYKVGETCYMYPTYNFGYGYGDIPNFKTRQEAEDYISKCGWIEKKGDNFWIDSHSKETYKDKYGNEIRCHYEIKESDYEVYEDEEYHTEYSDEEKQKLSEALYMIEKARVYMRVYDYCCDHCHFGKGDFSNELNDELKVFESNFTEELPKNDDF